MPKLKVDLDWHLFISPTLGPSWQCEALGCLFIAFPSPEVPDGWRLIAHNHKAAPGKFSPVGDDGTLKLTFEKAPVYATPEDCFAAVKRFITRQVGKKWPQPPSTPTSRQ